MATLALRPAFPIRPSSSGHKSDHRRARVRESARSRLWRALSMGAGALSLALFSVLAPLFGDPAGRLWAMDLSSTTSGDDLVGQKVRLAQAFEFTPNMLGPAIAAYMLDALDEDTDSVSPVTMPELVVYARPLSEEVTDPR